MDKESYEGNDNTNFSNVTSEVNGVDISIVIVAVLVCNVIAGSLTLLLMKIIPENPEDRTRFNRNRIIGLCVDTALIIITLVVVVLVSLDISFYFDLKWFVLSLVALIGDFIAMQTLKVLVLSILTKNKHELSIRPMTSTSLSN